jgi:hypothetical protein
VIFDTSINATNPAKMVLFTTFTYEDANDAELLSFCRRLLCGGATATIEQLLEWSAQFGVSRNNDSTGPVHVS